MIGAADAASIRAVATRAPAIENFIIKRWTVFSFFFVWG